MWIKCIACEALARPAYYAAALSAHTVDVELFRRGLHNQPNGLRRSLQNAIDACESRPYQAITLAYGLCGQATAGLRARSIPLVIPRAHDCITLFLGSRARYQQQFDACPGTYWYAQDYIARDDGSGSALAMGSEIHTDVESQYQQYVDKFGKDNADYLMQAMGAWQQHYQRAAFIDLGLGGEETVAEQARAEAERRGWRFERLAGDLTLVRRLLDGDWDGDFLMVPPGQVVRMSADDGILRAGNEDA